MAGRELRARDDESRHFLASREASSQLVTSTRNIASRIRRLTYVESRSAIFARILQGPPSWDDPAGELCSDDYHLSSRRHVAAVDEDVIPQAEGLSGSDAVSLLPTLPRRWARGRAG